MDIIKWLKTRVPRHLMGEKTALSTNSIGKLTVCVQKYKVDPLAFIVTKSNSKWIKNITVWHQPPKFPEENVQEKALWCRIWQWFFGYDSKSTGHKSKNRRTRWRWRRWTWGTSLSTDTSVIHLQTAVHAEHQLRADRRTWPEEKNL